MQSIIYVMVLAVSALMVCGFSHAADQTNSVSLSWKFKGMAYSQVMSNPMSLKPGEWVSAKVNLQAPRRVKTRVLVAVYGDNFLTSSVSSDWFTTG